MIHSESDMKAPDLTTEKDLARIAAAISAQTDESPDWMDAAWTGNTSGAAPAAPGLRPLPGAGRSGRHLDVSNSHGW